MQKTVKGRHTKLTDALRSYVDEKISSPLARVFDDPAAKLEVRLGDFAHAAGGQKEQCSVHFSMPAGHEIIISETDEDMYKAIDAVHNRLLPQVRKERDRLHDSHPRMRSAAKERAAVARSQLTVQPEEWEREAALYEASGGRA